MAKHTLLNPSGYTPHQVRKLHRHGFQVRGYIPGAPDAIQPRTDKYLRAQALKTIGLAYNPVEKALNTREARTRAIADKRQRDNEAYQAWLAQTQANMRTEADARNTALQNTVAQHQRDTRDSLLQVTQQAQTRLAAGNVSGSLDAAGTVSGAQRAAVEQGAARASALTDSQKVSGDILASTQANNMMAAKALEAKDFAKSLQELADVSDARTKVQLQKGSDMAKQLAHLFDMEVQKAQQNAQLQLAGQKLGVQMSAIKQRNTANIRTTKTAARGQDLRFQVGMKNAAIAADRLSETQRHNRAAEKTARDKVAKTDPQGASKTERAQQTQAIRAVNKMKAYLNDALGHPQGKVGSGTTSKHKTVDDFNAAIEKLRGQFANDSDLILLAYDLWRFGHLRPAARKRWKQEYGYSLPRGW